MAQFFLNTKEAYFGIISELKIFTKFCLCRQAVVPTKTFFRINKVHFVVTLSRRTILLVTVGLWVSNYSHNVEELNSDEDELYLLTQHPTLRLSLQQFLPENIRAITQNPDINLQLKGII